MSCVVCAVACTPPASRRIGEETAFDRVVLTALEKNGVTPALAGDEELCTRLFVDALGARPSLETIDARCAGRAIEDVVDELVASEDYRWTQRRRFADQLRYNDAMVDRASIRDLDRLVERLYQGELGYEELAIQVLAHPGFVGRFLAYGQEDSVAEGAFLAFLGRPATEAEAADLALLWEPWRAHFLDPTEVPEGDPSQYQAPLIDPFTCEAGKRACVSTILGVAALEFPRAGRSGLLDVDQLTDEDWFALRAPGRLFVAQPMFWEAAVDQVLLTYFGWDFGGALPEAREVLMEELRENGGDLRALERTVLLSAAYGFAGANLSVGGTAPAGEIRYAYGPTKFLTPEAWLSSVGDFIGADPGECDFRYPNLPDSGLAAGAPERISELEDRYPRNENGSIDPWFRDVASSIGGCPGRYDAAASKVSTRVRAPGIEQAVAQDEAALVLCTEHAGTTLAPREAESLEQLIARSLERAFGRRASSDEVDELARAAREGCPSCDLDAISKDLCVGLIGGVEYAAY